MATTTAVTQASSAVPQFPALDLKGKGIMASACEILKQECILVVTVAGRCRIFHNFGTTPIDLKERQVVYYDCGKRPAFINVGEIDWVIKDEFPSVVELVNKLVEDTSDGKTGQEVEAEDQMSTGAFPVKVTGAADLLSRIARNDVPYSLRIMVP